MSIDIEEINKKFQNIINMEFPTPSLDDALRLKPLIIELIASKGKNMRNVKYKHSFSGKNSYIMQSFHHLVAQNDIDIRESDEDHLRDILKIKTCKSHSGVLVITIFTSPYPEYTDRNTLEKKRQEFSCNWNCAYCPNEPGQPRSYLCGEPGVLRANKNGFDCIKQMWDRMRSLYLIGHNVDKLEVLVLGGTWTSYPLEYREEFCRDVYFAANTFWDKSHDRRDPLSIQEEKQINKIARTKVIGLTLETRPDTITLDEIRRLRLYGCTRVQLGIQHTCNDILETIKRRCTTEIVINAIKLLKDNCFKIDGHWMPNLPGSSPEKDREMLIDTLLGMKTPIIKRYTRGDENWEEYQLSFPELQVDQWKVYPCAIVPWTEIEQWYREGKFKPYSEDHLIDILLTMKSLIFPWIRLNRIIRDIPKDYIIASSDKSNLRQELKVMLEREGKACNCIRCREVKTNDWNGKYVLMIRQYDGSDGKELFISAESKNIKVLYGFVRLRFPSHNQNIVFDELMGCALIRELHVYGNLTKTIKDDVDTLTSHVQHKGIGKMLMLKAEEISKRNDFGSIAVIAGEGTKGYYEKLGYHDDGYFMVKKIK